MAAVLTVLLSCLVLSFFESDALYASSFHLVLNQCGPAHASQTVGSISSLSRLRRISLGDAAINTEKESKEYVWRYETTRYYPPYAPQDGENKSILFRLLHEMDPLRYPTKTQARKACQFGKVIVFRRGFSMSSLALARRNGIKANIENLDEIMNLVGNHNSTIYSGDTIAVLSRLPDAFYPPSSTGYILPPLLSTTSTQIVYEDNDVAIVNKPENVTTIGKKREDLQSLLPFILRPPRGSISKSNRRDCFFPRPVHRLDRRTSGLVLVAKTKHAMSTLSRSFVSRSVKKSYVALVFARDTSVPEQAGLNPRAWNTIDYPIDGKVALTQWRVLRHTSVSFGSVSMLELRPLTGRYHQIRRHLAYCLDRPIVGDSKYDGGCPIARSLRVHGMFLCAHRLNFSYPGEVNDDILYQVADYDGTEGNKVALAPNSEEIRLSAAIPLPENFLEVFDNLAQRDAS